MTETCAKRQRSFLLSTISPAFTLGVVVAYVIGGYLPWNIASAIFALSSFVYFVVQLLAPESPAWLFKRGRVDAAARSLRKLGRSPSGINHELQLLKLASSEESDRASTSGYSSTPQSGNPSSSSPSSTSSSAPPGSTTSSTTPWIS
ncbi:unnamed protein product [Bemisia tabaci]|uniref:Uncharacterized protein n=1 Tax=Bemisia tabaci TaxID=7038 RepID=A0A9P0F2G0_BEMTA|nr:unnamed protein product [Bemisia tabaci]